MTHTYTDQTFDGLRNDVDGNAVLIRDRRFVRCMFRGCHLSIVEDPTARAIVRNVELNQCRVFGESCTVDGAVIEDCVVDTFTAGGPMFLFGCVYKHLVIRGWLSSVVLDDRLIGTWAPDEVRMRYLEANAKYYETVDWALDISEAKCNDMGIRGIPSSLIRHDVRTQVVVSQVPDREKEWQQLDLDKAVRFWLENVHRNGWQDGIFVVPEKHPRRQRILDSLVKLRELGIAE